MKTRSIDGCNLLVTPKSARGLCRPHYRRLIKYGDPFVVKLGRPLEVRFWEKVRKADGCWEWIGRTNAYGYGIFTRGHTEKILAHRMAWMLMRGDTKELFCLHRCDNRRCVNPAHLFLGTQSDNLKDMWRKGRGRNQVLVKTKGAVCLV